MIKSFFKIVDNFEILPRKNRTLGNLVPRKCWYLEGNFYLWNKEKYKEMELNLPILEGNFDRVPGKKGIFSSRVWGSAQNMLTFGLGAVPLKKV